MLRLKQIPILCISLFLWCSTSAQDSTRIPINSEFLKKAVDNPNFNKSAEIGETKSKLLQELLESSECQIPTPPTKLADLTGGWAVFFHNMTLESAANVGIISIGDINANYGKEVYIYEQMNYKDLDNCKGGKTTYGAGIRLVIFVKKISASANLSSLGAIAASAEFKLADVTVNMKTIGLSGPKVQNAIPNAGTYSVEKHVEYLQAIDAIKAVTHDASTIVVPEVISFNIPVKHIDEMLKATYIGFALKRIAKGESYLIAKTKVKKPDAISDETIKNVYLGIVKQADETKPTAMQVLMAKELLQNTE